MLLNIDVPKIKTIMDFYRDTFDPDKSEFDNYVDTVIKISKGFYKALISDDKKIHDVDWGDQSTIDVPLWNEVVAVTLLDLALDDRVYFKMVVNDPYELLLRCTRGDDGDFVIH